MVVGSSSAAGRASAQGSLRGAEWPWAEAKPCFLCERIREHTATCEAWSRVAMALEEVAPGRLILGRPDELRVCKDCCIQQVRGHRCRWWRFCWDEW